MKKSGPGNTLTEYGIILSLAALLCVTGMSMFGKSTSNLLGENAGTLNSSSVAKMARLDFSGGASPASTMAGASSGKRRVMTLDSVTGEPVIGFADTASHGANTTSTEGSRIVATTMKVAGKLDNLMPLATNKQTANWLADITKTLYNMGGAQGSLEGIELLTASAKNVSRKSDYTDAAALRDIYNFQNDLLSQIQKAPPGADPALVMQVRQLTSTVWNQSQTYVTQLEPYIQDNGRLSERQLAESSLNAGMQNLLKESYDDLVPYSALQQKADTVLANDLASEVPIVENTLKTATTLNANSTGAVAY